MLRAQRVLLDADLAELYGVETKALVRAVRRNLDRFPDDFIFQLATQELADLRCQIGTSRSWGGRRYPPYAFTEQGVAMLSSVLRSKRAVAVNIEIMRAFVKLRELLAGHRELAEKLAPSPLQQLPAVLLPGGGHRDPHLADGGGASQRQGGGSAPSGTVGERKPVGRGSVSARNLEIRAANAHNFSISAPREYARSTILSVSRKLGAFVFQGSGR